jgi:hypothetical protein
MVEEADWLSGDHRLEGMLVAVGPEVTPGPLQETAYLQDLGPTSLAALGVASGINRDGRVLTSLVGDKQLEVNLAAGSKGDVGDSGLTSDEESEVEEHLRGLGYVE